MIAFGLMNVVGSFTSCYLTTGKLTITYIRYCRILENGLLLDHLVLISVSGPFSKTAVNYNAGGKTAMSNIVMAVCMALTLLFLAPIFSYTPIVALSAIIMSAMLGLIKYDDACHLFKVDKFDFCICMVAFLGVTLLTMDMGIMLSVSNFCRNNKSIESFKSNPNQTLFS